MGHLRAAATGHPVAAYFLVAFILSWGLQATMARQGIRLDAPDAALWLLLITLSPATAAVVVARLGQDRHARTAFLARLRTWKVPMRWYAIGAVVAAVAGLTGVVSFLLVGGRVSPQPAILAMVPVIMIAGFFEEMGWRGFALPGLLARMAPLPASLLLGAIWGIWHTPSQLFDPSPGTLAMVAIYVSQTIGLSILLTWLFLHSRGSILAAAVLHTAWNTVGLVLPVTDLAGRAMLGCAVLAVAGIVTIGGGARLARPASVNAAADAIRDRALDDAMRATGLLDVRARSLAIDDRQPSRMDIRDV